LAARVRNGWNKFRQAVPRRTNMDVSLLMRSKLYKGLCEVLCYVAVKHGG